MPLFSLLICASLQAVEANRAFDSKSESIFKHLVGSSITLRGVAERVEAVGGGREIVLADSKVRIRIPAEVLAANAGAFRDLDRLVGKEIFAHGGVVERDGDLLLEILVPAEIAGSAAELDESKFPQRENRRFGDVTVARFIFNLPARTLAVGVVRQILDDEGSDRLFIRLEGSEIVVAVDRATLQRFPDWQLESFVGKKVYLAALTDQSRGKKQLFIDSPTQIDTDPEKVRIANAPKAKLSERVRTRTSGKPADAAALVLSSVPEKVLPLGREEASCAVLLRYHSQKNLRMVADPFAGGAPAAQFDESEEAQVARVTAVARKVPGLGAMQVMVRGGEVDKFAAMAPLRDLAFRLGGWPDDVLVTVQIPQQEAELHPAVLALLVESLVSGKAIHPNIIVAEFGRRWRGGIGGVALAKRGLLDRVLGNHGQPVRLLVQDFSEDEVADLARAGEWSKLCQAQFLDFSGAGDLAAVALADADSPAGKALAGLDETNVVLKQRGATILKNPHVQQRVAAAEAVPTGKNLSARVYRMIGEGQLGEQFSLAYSNEILLDVTEALIAQFGKKANVRRFLAEANKRLDAVEPKLHPDSAKSLALCRKALDARMDAAKADDTRPSIIAFVDALEPLCMALAEATGYKITAPGIQR